jgi:hypothetical protein
MKKLLILCLLVCSPAIVFSQAEDRGGYITGTFLSGLGEHFLNVKNVQGFGTAVEIIKGGTVHWANEDVKNSTYDATLSWPLIFDMKLISRFGFGFTFGDMLTISMNRNYQDANHLYFGFSYVHSINNLWDIGASLIVFPVYITDDDLVAGKIDVSYWFLKDIGLTVSTIFGGTTGWSRVQVLFFNVLSIGISIKI